MPATQVFVAGLSAQTKPLALRAHFEAMGEVRSATIVKDPGTAEPSGGGKVDFVDEASAQRAVGELDGSWLDGCRLAVAPLGGAGAQAGRHRENDGRHVFFGGLSFDVDEDGLRVFASRAGPVAHAMIFWDRETGRHRGCGKVEFEAPESATRAIDELDRETLNGRLVTVELMGQESRRPAPRPRGPPEVDGRQLFVGALSPDTDTESLRSFCSRVGDVTYASVFTDRETGRSKGAGKVEFETVELAQRAIQELDGQTLDGRAVVVKVMEPRPPPHSSRGASSSAPSSSSGARPNDDRKVFVGSLTPSVDAQALQNLCEERIGGVIYATIFTDRETGQPKGTGKVEFETAELAQRAVQELHGFELDGCAMVVEPLAAAAAEERLPRGGGREPRGMQADADPECKLFVGSLPPEIGDDRLKELLSQAGEVRSAVVFSTSAGAAGRAVMAAAEDAQRAIAVLHDSFFMGKRLVVRPDRPPRERAAKPSLESMVFVGGISFETTSERLREHFAQVGEVVHANIFTDRDTGRSRGAGKVELASPDLVARAVEELNGSELDGRRLQVKPMEARPPGEARGGAAAGPPQQQQQQRGPRPNDGRQVFFGALPQEMESAELRAFCQERVGGVAYAAVFTDRDTGRPKGAGKVEFETVELADRAIRELDGHPLDGGRPIAVRRMGEERGPPRADGRTVFVGGLSWEAGTEDLKTFAGQVGEVSYANVFIDKETGKSRGSGKVQFATPELAQRAVDELTGRQLLGREVTVRMMGDRPQDGP